MPIYPYACRDCGQQFDVVKRLGELDRVEACPHCVGNNTKRCIALFNLDKESCGQPYFEPALGMVVKSKGHKRRILKERKLEEVGTTSVETLYKDNELAREKRMAKAWDEL